jgi:SAM-dependent methyltransferase
MSKFRLHAPEIGTFTALSNYLAARREPALAADWRIDTFGHEYVLRMRDWRQGERVLDVGCGYSLLPRTLHERFGVEAWGADDYGKGSMPYWSRSQDLEDFLKRNAAVKFVFELIGDQERSSLPVGYFDVVYSKLGVHFSPPPHAPLWLHMAALLKDEPGSSLVVMVGHNHVTEGAASSALERLERITRVEDSVLQRLQRGEKLQLTFWNELQEKIHLRQSSPFLYCAYVCSVLGVSGFIPSEDLRAEQFCLNPHNLIDPPHKGILDALYSRRASEVFEFMPGRYTPVIYRFERV